MNRHASPGSLPRIPSGKWRGDRRNCGRVRIPFRQAEADGSGQISTARGMTRK